MSCYHPMVLVKTSDMTDPEQRRIADILRLKHKGEGRSTTTFLIAREIAEKEGLLLEGNNAVLVPCGHCVGCRLDYSRQWAERCMHEAEQYENNYFLTLTYDADHLPMNEQGLPTLLNDEISSFMKRLRKIYADKYDFQGIRFFGASEYGTSGERGINPHYHIIIFNLPVPDIQDRHPIKVDGKVKWIKQYSKNGDLLYFSPTIAKAWTDKKGQLIGTCQLGALTFESAAYVSRYTLKKFDGPDIKCEDLGLVAPYVRMSRRPGIGSKWYVDNLDNIYQYDKIPIKRGDKTVYSNPGRFCDNELKKVDEQRFYEMKEKRHNDLYSSINCKTFEGVDLVVNNLRAEDNKKRSIKTLKRSL